MLGVFAKTLSGEPIKSRLGSALSAAERQAFYVACLADALETAVRFEPRPTLFLSGGEDAPSVDALRARVLDAGLQPDVWMSLRLEAQRGQDLGTRLETAIQSLASDSEAGALVIGSDSPALRIEMLRDAAHRLHDRGDPIDVVLGPTRDGGYWTIGMRRPYPGFLHGVAWSTPRALADTQRRASERGLRVGLAATWTDVDVPADLAVLAEQIRGLRQEHERDTARHAERFMRERGWMDSS